MMQELEVLDNGVTLIKVPNENTRATSVFFGFKAGSRYENTNNNGISHFLEHCHFNGTTKRPDSNAISKELDYYGAQFNAFTDKGATVYYITISNNQKDLALDVLDDMLFNSTFELGEHEKEKDIVCEEIQSYADDTMSQLFDLVDSQIYPNQPMGMSIAGTKENVRAFTKKGMLAYKDSRYNSETAYVAVSGNYDQAFIDKVKESTKKFNRPETPPVKVISEKTKLNKLAVKKRSDIQQVNMNVSFFAPDCFSSKLHSTIVLSSILGGYQSSILFQKIREELGLCYQIGAYARSFFDVGTFGVFGITDKSKYPLLKSEIFKVLNGIKGSAITDDEVDRAKNNAIGKLALSSESSSSVAQKLLMGKIDNDKFVTIDESISKYQAVTKQSVIDVANEIFTDNYNISVVAPEDWKDSD